MIIPFDIKSANFLAFILDITKICPFMDYIGTCYCSPVPISLIQVPILTFVQYKLVELGCQINIQITTQHQINYPTLKSICEKSLIESFNYFLICSSYVSISFSTIFFYFFYFLSFFSGCLTCVISYFSLFSIKFKIFLKIINILIILQKISNLMTLNLIPFIINPKKQTKSKSIIIKIYYNFSQQIKLQLLHFIYNMNQLSILSPDAIRNSPLNNSTAKRINMFSKEQRFKVPAPNCPVACYNLPSQLSRRKASFGYGIKSDFTKSSVLSPACNAYQAKSIFEKGEKSNGKTFGISRQLSPEFGIITQDIIKFPGPGKYECKKDTLSTICYTMRPQTVDFIEKRRTNRYNPGPGQHQHLQAMPKDGKAFFQRFQTSKFAKINTGARWKSKKDSPSPHTYDVKNNLSRDGKYVLSINKGSGTRAFSQTMRNNFTEQTAKLSITPGPGIYQSPTQFGIYGDSKFLKDKINQTIS